MNTPENMVEVMQRKPSAHLILPQEERQRMRKRSLAIAWALGALVVIFFVATIVRIGNTAFN